MGVSIDESQLANLYNQGGSTDEGLAMLFGYQPPPPTPASTPTPPPAAQPQPSPIPATGGANPGEFAMGSGFGIFGNAPSFQPNPQVLSQAGSAATPFGFGSPNPYAGYFNTGPASGGSSVPGAMNANAMQRLMGNTPLTPQPPASVPIQPVNIPGITFSGGG